MWSRSGMHIMAVFDGGIASVGFFALYMITMRIFTRGWSVGIQRFIELRPYFMTFFLSVLILVGVSRWVQEAMKKRYGFSQTLLASSGTTMILCCLHHVTDIVPFLGLSSASLLLFRYQPVLLIGSTGINLCIAGWTIRKYYKRDAHSPNTFGSQRIMTQS
ncbi:MAG TPA: hypothetical protein DIU47_03015 [Candidatus Pacebacteria bacterium]|nr:MAG: hypothetical protein UX00_C0017G0007 [Microgenomates group bacterium GW2011_GWB1_45_17]KKU23199.1 MAG: hypothetical protein UX35_C0009G0023 [Microgenomates group bacterium GW2011_GWA1_46_15]KKU24053.1 MAG: hypothetical protein UX36_C0002G0036 [Microgenomates group bacterium GW2011_GWC1_46_15]HCR11249.1 hypothetical protein [Candidatus Paceibacterota bacterium]HCR92898.1 hypothetical protein [Candidatus Paceibacterota bacterium]